MFCWFWMRCIPNVMNRQLIAGIKFVTHIYMLNWMMDKWWYAIGHHFNSLSLCVFFSHTFEFFSLRPIFHWAQRESLNENKLQLTLSKWWICGCFELCNRHQSNERNAKTIQLQLIIINYSLETVTLWKRVGTFTRKF